MRIAALAALIILPLAVVGAFAASILLPLAMLSAWQIQEQSRTRTEPAVAIAVERVVASGSEAKVALSEASDRDQSRQRTVDALLVTLDEGDFDGYLDALRAFSESDLERTMEILIGRLAEAGPSEDLVAVSRRRVLAAQGLGMLSDARAVEPLLETLNSDDHQVRIAAVSALLQIRRVQPLAEEPESPPTPERVNELETSDRRI